MGDGPPDAPQRRHRSIESGKEARKHLAALEALIAKAPAVSVPGRRRARDELTRVVEEANRAIARVNAEAPTVRQHRRPLDRAVEAARLEEAFERDSGR